jgi:flagellar biosynthesis protein FliP
LRGSTAEAGKAPRGAVQVTPIESFTMSAQNAIRLAMTAFTGIVVALSVVGIRWTSQHQPPASAMASAAVLGISSAFAVVALVIIWRSTTRR